MVRSVVVKLLCILVLTVWFFVDSWSLFVVVFVVVIFVCLCVVKVIVDSKKRFRRPGTVSRDNWRLARSGDVRNRSGTGVVAPSKWLYSKSNQTDMSYLKSVSPSLDKDDAGHTSDLNMSVGEFPLISLVSSLQESVSPKSRLKPTPVSIRIQPIQPLEHSLEPKVDPVVSVLKQLSSNKRVLAPTIGASDEESAKEKRMRSMPRHDLTHSLLESQLTVCRESGNNKREREEVCASTGSPFGTPLMGTPPKKLCARSLRSNEILSSLSSSISLGAHQSPSVIKTKSSYTGKRKSVSFDKYKKIRRLETQSNQSKAENQKVDRGVGDESLFDEPPPLPIISIKRDEISERVVSRAMVSALLKSTVNKLMLCGDGSITVNPPVPNGTQVRLPEVSVPQFGPPGSSLSVLSTSAGGGLSSAASQPLGMGVTPLSVSLPQTDALPASLSSGVQTSFSLTKPQVSTVVAPSFGLSGAPSAPLQFGAPSTTSSQTPAVPTFGLTSQASSPSNFNAADKSDGSAFKPPSFGLPSATGDKVSTPSFGLPSSTGDKVSTPSFGLPSATGDKVSTPTFGIPTGGDKPSIPSFGLPTTTTDKVSTPTFNFTSSNPTSLSSSTTAPIFGIATTPSTLQSKTEVSTTTTSVVTSAPIVFGNLAKATEDQSKPTVVFGGGDKLIFGSPKTDPVAFGLSSATPLFGATTKPSTTDSVTSAVVTQAQSTQATSVITSNPSFGATTSTPIFGGFTAASTTTPSTTASTVFGGSAGLFSAAQPSTTNAAPVFGSDLTSFGVKNTEGASSTPTFSSTTTNSSTLFGTSTTATAPLFGAATTTTATPLFGTSTTTPLFGNKSATPLFGAVTTATPLFGNTTTTTTTPLFGTASTPIFGSSTATGTAPVFGAATTKTPLFGGSTSTPVFGGATTDASATPLFGSTTTTSTTTTTNPIFGGGTGFGATAGAKPSPMFGSTQVQSSFNAGASTKPEGLFGMPSSDSGFKAVSPFQVGGTDSGSTSSGFGSMAQSGGQKPFEFGAKSGSSAGGFTFKPSGGAAAQQAAPSPSFAQPQSSSFSSQPQAPFSFTGGGAVGTAPSTGSSPFVFGSPAPTASAPNANAATGAKTFQFGSAAPGMNLMPAPSYTPGQGFAPLNSAAPNFAPSQSPTPGAFQFNAPQQPAPGASSGLFSIGTGGSSSRARERRDRRRR